MLKHTENNSILNVCSTFSWFFFFLTYFSLFIVYLNRLSKDLPLFFFFSILFTIILSIITIVLIFNNKLNIEEKFGYFAIAYIFIGIFSYDFLLGLILYSLVILLFVPYLNENYSSFEFFKSNRILLLGLASIIGIFFAWSTFIIFDFIPGLEEFPLIIFFYLRWIILLCLMMISLIFLKFKDRKLNLRNNF